LYRAIQLPMPALACDPLATLLKARQDLGCFPAPVEMHGDTVKHLAAQLGLAFSTISGDRIFRPWAG
jgi:hypothetical protein